MTEAQTIVDHSDRDLTRRNTTIAFLVTITLTVFVYYPVLTHMILTWRVDPDYSHGFLIVPLALYFAYEKTPKLRRAGSRGVGGAQRF